MITTSRIDNYLRIAIFVSRYAVGTTPCTLHTAVLLARDGYDVDIFCYQPFDDPSKIRLTEKNIYLHDLTEPGTPTRGDIPDHVLNRAAAIIDDRHYVCFVGMEAQGLIFAGQLADRFRVPLIYYSAELYYAGHPHMDPAEMARIKPQERKYHARSIATIVQDEERGRILAEDNRVKTEKTFYVPVGMLGDGINRRERYFHRMFNLPDTERVLLQFGTIHPYRQSNRIAEISATLPEGWTLVMHGFVDRQVHEVVRAMKDPSKIRLSSALVDMDDLPKVVASADVGLVFYTDDNLNDYNTGLASDKMARHMQCGMPVITCNFPSFQKVLDRYGCGLSVANPVDIPRVLSDITADYDTFCRGARQAYRELYNYETQFRPVLDYLYEISTPPPESKHEAIAAYADRYGPMIFVETGTFMGDTIQAVREKFRLLYSIELSYPLFKQAQARFVGDPNIVLVNGDSAETLPRLLDHIEEPCLFWLDGHYSGGITAKGAKSTPIMEELESIFSHGVHEHVILIDDARDFKGTGDYPRIEELQRFVRDLPGYWRFEVADGIIAILPDTMAEGQGTSSREKELKKGDDTDTLKILSRGAALVEQGRLAEAEELFLDLLSASPGDIEARFGLAGVQWKKGKRQEASRTLMKIMEAAPDDRDTIWNLGRILGAMGLVQDSCRVYERYLQNQGGDGEMEQALSRWRIADAPGSRIAPNSGAVGGEMEAAAECIVFSKDRAMQLQALLASYFEQVRNPVPVHLLYRTSSAAHQRSYEQVIDLFFGRLASVTVDAPFRKKLLELLNAIRAPKMFFLVDDALFIQKTDMADFTRLDTDRFVPSLRLAPHLTRCYTLDKDQPLPRFLTGVLPDADKICWRWADGAYDWCYPLSVDGHLFSTQEMRRMIHHIDFTAPNSLEDGLQAFRGDFINRIGVGYRQSRIVNIPCNMVQTERNNLHGNLHQDDLLQKFNQGFQIDYRMLYGLTNHSAHQELELGFIPRMEMVCPRKVQPKRQTMETLNSNNAYLAREKIGDRPLVSVVIPCYNQAAFLPEAVASVAAQTYPNLEVFIVNDGSADETSEVARGLIEKYPELPITLIEQENRGLPAARNAGIGASGGEFWLPLDSDDRIAPTFVAKCVRALQNLPEAGFVYTDIQHFGELDTVFRLPAFDAAAMVHTNNIGCVCSLVRRSVWEAVGGYDTCMREGYEDWDFWVGCIEKGWGGFRIAEPLFFYRKHAGSMLTDARKKHDALFARIVLNHPSLYSVQELQTAALTIRARTEEETATGRLVENPGARNRLTVTYLIHSILGVTGGNQTLIRQANALCDRGHRVNIVTYTDKPAWFDLDARVIKVPESEPLAGFVPQSDVVIATYFLNAPELLKVSAPVRIYFAQGDQYVFGDNTPLADPSAQAERDRMRRLCAESYRIPGIHFVANSWNLAATVQYRYGRKADGVIPACKDQDIFKPMDRQPTPPWRILVVGPDSRGSALEPLTFKGIREIRTAVELLEKKNEPFQVVRMSNTTADIFKGYPCVFHFKPADGKKTDIFGRAHILVYASHYDSCPFPPMEAMAAGAAVVCTATPGALEYCRHEENCLLVPVGSPKAIAGAVERIMNDRSLMEKIVAGGLATAARYPREREWDILEQLLFQFLDAAEGRQIETGKDDRKPGAAAVMPNHKETEAPAGNVHRAETLPAQGRETIPMKTPANPHDERSEPRKDLRSIEKMYAQAKSLLDGGDSKEAVAVLERIIEGNQGIAPIHNDLGVLYYQAGDMPAAMHHYEKAVEIEPGNTVFRKNLADFYCVGQGRIEEAMRMYVDLLAVNPEDVEVLMSMGLICSALQRPEDAKHFYSRVLEAEPWNADARQQLSLIEEKNSQGVIC